MQQYTDICNAINTIRDNVELSSMLAPYQLDMINKWYNEVTTGVKDMNSFVKLQNSIFGIVNSLLLVNESRLNAVRFYVESVRKHPTNSGNYASLDMVFKMIHPECINMMKHNHYQELLAILRDYNRGYSYWYDVLRRICTLILTVERNNKYIIDIRDGYNVNDVYNKFKEDAVLYDVVDLLY